jgi:hypothetical protein
MKYFTVTLTLLWLSTLLSATDYNVGPGQELAAISEVPWATLEPGDRVYIHWKDSPYKEKWVINRQGTEANRIEVIGVDGPGGEQAVIDGDGAATPLDLNYWNEVRGVIKIGGSSIPEDGLPSYITIDNLEIRSAHPDYQFTNDNGNIETYVDNAAAIYVEKAAHLIIRNCNLHDSGNGLFIGAYGGQTEDILIEKNHIHSNGIVGEYLEHNTYTEAINITYQFNHFGPLRDGADGNNLKDRSAGLVVRHNWIEGGNRQLDLVDAEGSEVLVNHPNYSETHVYGNILIEPDDEGNSQIVHYGGDSGTTDDYRKGILYFYNNTVISTRQGNTTLVRLSTEEETAHVFNNIIYTTAPGESLAMIAGTGIMNMNHNWLMSGWVECHCLPTGTINDLGENTTGDDPGFESFDDQEFRPIESSEVVNQASSIPADLLSEHDVILEYVKHQDFVERPEFESLDKGAFEYFGIVTNLESTYPLTSNLYPNPASNTLRVRGWDIMGEPYQIRNPNGQLVGTGTMDGDQTIDVSSLQPGLHIIEIGPNQLNRRAVFIKR